MIRKTVIIASVIIFAVIIAVVTGDYLSKRLDKEILRVEVLNGTKENGIAGKFAEYLRNEKLDVIIVSNARYDTISETMIIDRMKPNAVYGKYIARRIDCSNVMSQIDSSLYVDVTIIVGNDFQKYLKEKKDNEQ